MASPTKAELKAIAKIELAPQASKVLRILKRKGVAGRLDPEENRTLQRLLGRVVKKFA